MKKEIVKLVKSLIGCARLDFIDIELYMSGRLHIYIEFSYDDSDTILLSDILTMAKYGYLKLNHFLFKQDNDMTVGLSWDWLEISLGKKEIVFRISQTLHSTLLKEEVLEYFKKNRRLVYER